jgi:hypothetical protein
MAKRKQIGLDLTKYPELYDALMTLAEQKDTTPPRLVRRFVVEGLDVQAHADKVTKAAQKQAARLREKAR